MSKGRNGSGGKAWLQNNRFQFWTSFGGLTRFPLLSGLDIFGGPSQNTANFETKPTESPSVTIHFAIVMTPKQPSQPPKQKISRELCKHPQVQIVSRDEDSEYVECKECGDIFESSEFKDMRIEETKLGEEE
jgi:hypothetical protein